jgi:hypothetical protein
VLFPQQIVVRQHHCDLGLLAPGSARPKLPLRSDKRTATRVLDATK